MESTRTLTRRDEEVVDTLTRRVRCLSMEQIASSWWANRKSALSQSRARVRALEQAGWLERLIAFAKHGLDLRSPVTSWTPGQPIPDFGKIAQFLKTRFATAAVATPIVVATATAAKRRGGHGGRRPRRSEVTHDLGLASVYLQLLQTQPERAKHWVSEATLVAGDGGEGRGQKLPDALIRMPNGSETVIEFGGEYDRHKLALFHADCAERRRSYELW
jgi:hypothetical protein